MVNVELQDPLPELELGENPGVTPEGAGAEKLTLHPTEVFPLPVAAMLKVGLLAVPKVAAPDCAPTVIEVGPLSVKVTFAISPELAPTADRLNVTPKCCMSTSKRSGL